MGSVLPPPAPPGVTGLDIYLAGPQGQLVGGAISGPLIASSPIVIMAATFMNATFDRLPIDKNETEAVTTAQQNQHMISLSDMYGISQTLAAAQPPCHRPICTLGPEMHPEKQKNESRRQEAWRVHGALMCAAGLCIYSQLKMIPNLLSPPSHSIWKRNGKFGTANPNKRKLGGTNNMMDQSLKKVATADGSHLVKVEMQGPSSGFSITHGGTDAGMHQLPMFLTNDNMAWSSGRRGKFCGTTHSSVAVSRAWKKEINAGHLLPKLYDLFGQGMFPFVPSPELCNLHL